MLQQDSPCDYVIGTGESHSVREFVEFAFKHVGVELEWKGRGVDEKGIVCSLTSNLQHPTSINIGDTLIEIDTRYFRPTEVDFLRADIRKAQEKLGWTPKVTFQELVKIMVDSDRGRVGLKLVGESEKMLKQKGIDWLKIG